eukprot:6788595-Prymnesium_polylepis.1
MHSLTRCPTTNHQIARSGAGESGRRGALLRRKRADDVVSTVAGRPFSQKRIVTPQLLPTF